MHKADTTSTEISKYMGMINRLMMYALLLQVYQSLCGEWCIELNYIIL